MEKQVINTNPFPKEEKKYIVQDRKIDRLTIKRSRAPITPAVCDICGLDLLKLNKIPRPWDKITAGEQSRIIAAVDEHRRLAHTSANALIVTESQLSRGNLDKSGGELNQEVLNEIIDWVKPEEKK